MIGFGIYRWISGAYYEGNWENNLPHGIGKESLPDGTTYEGQFFQGLKEGCNKYLNKLI